MVIANSIGSGVVENEAIMSFLPSLSRQVLGEDLKIPSVPTWWCGNPADRAHVLAHLDELVVRTRVRIAFVDRQRQPRLR